MKIEGLYLLTLTLLGSIMLILYKLAASNTPMITLIKIDSEMETALSLQMAAILE
jgi:hypothetical protein